MPRSTQPSTLRGTVKWVSLSGWVIIINGDGGCGFWQPTGRLTARVIWPGLRVGGSLAPCHINHMDRVNSRSGFELLWQHHKYCHWYYYYYYYYYYRFRSAIWPYHLCRLQLVPTMTNHVLCNHETVDIHIFVRLNYHQLQQKEFFYNNGPLSMLSDKRVRKKCYKYFLHFFI